MNPTFYRTVVDSPEWQAWVKLNETTPRFDVYESMECGWLSVEHFAAFLSFVRYGSIKVKQNRSRATRKRIR